MTAEWRVGGCFHSGAGVKVLSEPTDTSLITLNEDVIAPQCLLKLSDRGRAAHSPGRNVAIVHSGIHSVDCIDFSTALHIKHSDHIRQINVIQGRPGRMAAVYKTTVSTVLNTSCRIYKLHTWVI